MIRAGVMAVSGGMSLFYENGSMTKQPARGSGCSGTGRLTESYPGAFTALPACKSGTRGAARGDTRSRCHAAAPRKKHPKKNCAGEG